MYTIMFNERKEGDKNESMGSHFILAKYICSYKPIHPHGSGSIVYTLDGREHKIVQSVSDVIDEMNRYENYKKDNPDE